MTVLEQVLEHLREMPEPLQAEVLDFVRFLESKEYGREGDDERLEWSAFSLSTAMRGMEGEEISYSLDDLKEVFQ